MDLQWKEAGQRTLTSAGSVIVLCPMVVYMIDANTRLAFKGNPSSASGRTV